MRLVKEDIDALQRRLATLHERGQKYFSEAEFTESEGITVWSPKKSLEIKGAKALQECDALRQAIKELSVDIAGAAWASPLLADADMHKNFGTTLGRCLRMCTFVNTVTLESTFIMMKAWCSEWFRLHIKKSRSKKIQLHLEVSTRL